MQFSHVTSSHLFSKEKNIFTRHHAKRQFKFTLQFPSLEHWLVWEKKQVNKPNVKQQVLTISSHEITNSSGCEWKGLSFRLRCSGQETIVTRPFAKRVVFRAYVTKEKETKTIFVLRENRIKTTKAYNPHHPVQSLHQLLLSVSNCLLNRVVYIYTRVSGLRNQRIISVQWWWTF